MESIGVQFHLQANGDLKLHLTAKEINEIFLKGDLESLDNLNSKSIIFKLINITNLTLHSQGQILLKPINNAKEVGASRVEGYQIRNSFKSKYILTFLLSFPIYQNIFSLTFGGLLLSLLTLLVILEFEVNKLRKNSFEEEVLALINSQSNTNLYILNLKVGVDLWLNSSRKVEALERAYAGLVYKYLEELDMEGEEEPNIYYSILDFTSLESLDGKILSGYKDKMRFLAIFKERLSFLVGLTTLLTVFEITIYLLKEGIAW